MEWTSLGFLTNTVHAAAKGYGVYALTFFTLATTSVLFHTSDKTDSVLFWLDQAAIYCVFGIGFLYFLRIPLRNQILAAISILFVIAFYFGGYATNTLCWGPHAEIYHCCMHLIGAAGHHCIMAAL
jgi:hypothetical protein